MKTILALTFFCLCSFSFAAHAQNSYSIKGVVTDTSSRVKLANTSITILNSKDSTLVKFGRTATDGSFSLSLIKGQFILLVAYPDYADYVGKFELDSIKRTQDLGQISLKLKARLLEEIVINGTAAITIKGDTTVFSTSNLKLQPNSNVEDLLKQLPGIQVDQNGKITAQGQAVNKVLVDGEEFFGDDPTLVTKNLKASMVKSVELFDKKSDQAAFTGIDDGVKTKTLNVVLKEDSKNGYFGKVDAGETPDNYYQGQAMVNKFKTKMKFSAYGNVGNTGRTGLGGFEGQKYGFSNTMVSDGNGQFLPSDDLESFSGRYDGRGIPLARTSGLHYDTKWNKDKKTLNVNYKIGSINVDGTQNNINQNNLPLDVIINNNSDQSYNNYMFRQKLDASYEIKFSPTSTFKITVDGTLKNSESSNNNIAISTRGDNSLLNTGNRNLSNDADQKIFNTGVLWTKRLKKAGRTFSLNVSESLTANDSKGFLNSTNKFYDTAGTPYDTVAIDQFKTGKNTSSILGSNMTWSEPLSKTFSVIFNYGLVFRNETSERTSFNKSGTGKYDLLDLEYSNNFDLDQISNQAGAIFNYTKNKTVVNFGTRISAVNYDQTDLDNNIHYKRNYFNINPQVRYQYRFSQQRSISFYYIGMTTQPAMNQLQPIKVNDDPLNITSGNPDLKPSFRSNLSTSYSSSKPLKGSSIYISGNYSLTSSPIVSNRLTDAAGKSTIQSVNIKDKNPSNYSLFLTYGLKVKKTVLQLGPNLNINGNTSYGYINNEINTSRTASYSSGISLSASKVQKYMFRIQVDPRYTINSSSLRPQFNDNTWGLSSNAYLTLYLPGKMEIYLDARYTYTEKTQAFSQSINPFIWNSTISKKFLKKDNLKFSISGSDLLNQNTGFTRAAYSQSSYTTIQRYFMGSLTWDFTKTGGAAPKK